MKKMKISEIKMRAPFNDLFQIKDSVLAAIKEHIVEHGYDESQPIIIWDEEEVVLDGHTRLEAARQAGMTEVPIFYQPFSNEAAALEYAIHNQRNRRNLTDAEIIRCIDAVDKKRERGGDRRSEAAKSKPPNGGIEKCKSPSAQETAHIVGVSTRQVERGRKVLADPEASAEVKAGKKTISKAYKEIQADKKSHDQPEPNRQAILQKAFDEIRKWRETYKDYQELSAIFEAVDGCQIESERRDPLPEAEVAPRSSE
jgi:ParB-like chromosome segregation protein Spo0J